MMKMICNMYTLFLSLGQEVTDTVWLQGLIYIVVLDPSRYVHLWLQSYADMWTTRLRVMNVCLQASVDNKVSSGFRGGHEDRRIGVVCRLSAWFSVQSMGVKALQNKDKQSCFGCDHGGEALQNEDMQNRYDCDPHYINSSLRCVTRDTSQLYHCKFLQ